MGSGDNYGQLYWIHHYLQQGFKPDYLINLTEKEKNFFICSLQQHWSDKAKYDAELMKILLENLAEIFNKVFGGGNG